MTSLLTLAQRSLLRFSGDLAGFLFPSPVDDSAVRPIGSHEVAQPGVAIRWVGHECFRGEASRDPANDNRPLAEPRSVAWRSSARAIESRRSAGAMRTLPGNPAPRGLRRSGNREIGLILVDDAIGINVPPFDLFAKDDSESPLEAPPPRRV